MPARAAAVFLAIAASGPLAAALAGCRRPAEPAIRVDRASFVRALGQEGAARVEDALADVLSNHARDFPQPPPLEIVLRAVPREEQDLLMNAISYGGMHLEGTRAVVEVHPRTISGPEALNDAELRSLLGHEVTHGYQCARTGCSDVPPELWRREVQAFEWELANMGADARREYREDTAKNLDMYRSLLRSQGSD